MIITLTIEKKTLKSIKIEKTEGKQTLILNKEEAKEFYEGLSYYFKEEISTYSNIYGTPIMYLTNPPIYQYPPNPDTGTPLPSKYIITCNTETDAITNAVTNTTTGEKPFNSLFNSDSPL